MAPSGTYTWRSVGWWNRRCELRAGDRVVATFRPRRRFSSRAWTLQAEGTAWSLERPPRDAGIEARGGPGQSVSLRSALSGARLAWHDGRKLEWRRSSWLGNEADLREGDRTLIRLRPKGMRAFAVEVLDPTLRPSDVALLVGLQQAYTEGMAQSPNPLDGIPVLD